MTDEAFTDYGSIEALDQKIRKIHKKKPGEFLERNELLIKTSESRNSAIVGLLILETYFIAMTPNEKAELISTRDTFLPGREIFVYSPGHLYI